jgi:hypothetical protein
MQEILIWLWQDIRQVNPVVLWGGLALCLYMTTMTRRERRW